MAIFVALDAGGTRTQCWVADETRVLAAGTCGTVKLMNVGEDTATRRLKGLLETTAAEAGVQLEEVERTCMGLAGVASESVRLWGETTLGRLLGGEVLLCGDEEIALEAAFRGGPGVLAIAGTGSNVVGRCSDGTRVTAGGWGPVIGDEGSGNWIGLEAVRSALRARDRGQSTTLLRAVQGFWELKSLGELIAKANQRVRANFAELTTVVAQCAEEGDAVAAEVLERAGLELAEQVLLVRAKMRAVGCAPGDAARVAFTGSVLEKIPPVWRAMQGRLQMAARGVKVAAKPVNALEGALWKARSEGGVELAAADVRGEETALG